MTSALRPPSRVTRPEHGIRFSGRWFSTADLDLIREVAREFPSLSLTELARTLSELLCWKRPNGKLKTEECRALLEHLQAGGLLCLPAIRTTRPRGSPPILPSAQSDPAKLLTGKARQYEPLALHRVEPTDHARSSLFNQFIDRYHYLGYRVAFGASLRYLVTSERCPQNYLACLIFSSPAWKMAARDAWIGWSGQQRRRRLQYIVNNSRFLILPWVQVPNLASKILSLAARQLPDQWQQQYGYRPLLLETLVDPLRFGGACYRAANWIYAGKTQGRGRIDRRHLAHGRAIKDIYVLPLSRDAIDRLRASHFEHP